MPKEPIENESFLGVVLKPVTKDLKDEHDPQQTQAMLKVTRKGNSLRLTLFLAFYLFCSLVSLIFCDKAMTVYILLVYVFGLVHYSLQLLTILLSTVSRTLIFRRIYTFCFSISRQMMPISDINCLLLLFPSNTPNLLLYLLHKYIFVTLRATSLLYNSTRNCNTFKSCNCFV